MKKRANTTTHMYIQYTTVVVRRYSKDINDLILNCLLHQGITIPTSLLPLQYSVSHW